MFLFLLIATCLSEETGLLKGVTNQHNFYRCRHGSPFIVWDDDLQASAALHAKARQDLDCTPERASTSNGQNLLWSHAVNRVGRTTVDIWYSDNGRYTTAISDMYAEYYQVIWKSSLKVGCAVATCPLIQDQLVICHYDTPVSFLDTNVRANVGNVVRLVTECQTIVDAHELGMFVSTETDETNPAGIAVGAGIGAITTVIFGLLFLRGRQGWLKWTSGKLANQQPVVVVIVQICVQIATFGLMVRALGREVVWATLPDGSTFNPKQICFMRTTNGVPGAPCVPFEISAICSHEYICNSAAACAAAVIFLILACVCAWLNLACQAPQIIPRMPLDPKPLIPFSLGFLVVEIFFVWNLLWFLGGYVVSYLSLGGFVMANEGFIEIIVCLPLFFVMAVICSAQMTLNTK